MADEWFQFYSYVIRLIVASSQMHRFEGTMQVSRARLAWHHKHQIELTCANKRNVRTYVRTHPDKPNDTTKTCKPAISVSNRMLIAHEEIKFICIVGINLDFQAL